MLHVRAAELAGVPNTECSRQILAGPQTGIESCEISLCWAAPLSQVSRPTASDRMVYVLSGELAVAVGAERRVVKSETFLLLPQGAEYSLSNDQDAVTTFLDLVVPLKRGVQQDGRQVDLDSLIRPVLPDAFQIHSTRTVQGTPLGIQILADKNSGSSDARVFAAIVPPGNESDRHIHMFDQFYYVIDGTFSIEVGTTTYHVPAHHLVVLPAGTIHRNWNQSDSPVFQITILTPEPPAGVPRTIPATLHLPDGATA